MLSSSQILFLSSSNKLAIEFQIKNLDSTILESIIGKKIEATIDSEKLYLLNRNNKSSIALLYNVSLLDARDGWMFKKTCMAAHNLGFIITPMTRWERHRVIECYTAIKSNIYEVYFDLDKLDLGLIYLVIVYKPK
jgi:hypothetical protein